MSTSKEKLPSAFDTLLVMSTPDELRMLADSAAGAMRGATDWPMDDFDDQWRLAWKRLDDLGLLQLFSAGATVVDAVVVHEQAGRALFGGPLAAAHGADYLLHDTAAAAAAPGLLLAAPSSDVRASSTDQGVTLTGRLAFTSAPDGAAWLVWPRGDDRLLRVEASDVAGSEVPRHEFDTTRRHFVADLAAVPSSPMPAISWSAAANVDDVLALFSCADSVGAIDRALSMTAEYARTRETFGAPIARNQAVAFPLVQHTLTLRKMRLVTYEAAEALAAEKDDAHALALAARIVVGTHGVGIISDCIQLTGGIGFTWEWGLHHLARRVAINTALMGGLPQARAQLARNQSWGA